jgi:RNA recognition motif-containing protein
MTFENKEQAIKAVQEMNNKVIIGKTVQVSLDEQTESPNEPYRMLCF